MYTLGQQNSKIPFSAILTSVSEEGAFEFIASLDTVSPGALVSGGALVACKKWPECFIGHRGEMRKNGFGYTTGNAEGAEH